MVDRDWVELEDGEERRRCVVRGEELQRGKGFEDEVETAEE